MAQRIDVTVNHGIADYEAVAHLAWAVRELQREAEVAQPMLGNRTVWMVNSTPQGGGVAEMLPGVIALLREVGIRAEWVVIETDREEFFALTKRIHNQIHGSGTAGFGRDDRELFDAVNRENAALLADRMRPGDILVVHDPQPAALGPILRETLDIHTVWRCHIGTDEENAATRDAWDFLEPYVTSYEHGVFSAPEYIPPFFAGRASIIYPAINPLTHKNRELGLHKTVGVLASAGLAVAPGPLVTPPYAHQALRLHTDGAFYPANAFGDIGLLTRPIVTQVSRWDRLKGYEPLMQAFIQLKTARLVGRGGPMDATHRSRLELARLVLAGPDPASIQDDPEGLEVLEALQRRYLSIDPLVQESIALITLPMVSRKENALMVNALQRASTIVAQNSVREGFGLTITEAMWKRAPILSNGSACGPRQQVRDRVDGRLVRDAEDVDDVARTLDEMLADPDSRAEWGRNGQRRVHDDFLIFSQVRQWIRLLTQLVSAEGGAARWR